MRRAQSRNMDVAQEAQVGAAVEKHTIAGAAAPGTKDNISLAAEAKQVVAADAEMYKHAVRREGC